MVLLFTHTDYQVQHLTWHRPHIGFSDLLRLVLAVIVQLYPKFDINVQQNAKEVHALMQASTSQQEETLPDEQPQVIEDNPRRSLGTLSEAVARHMPFSSSQGTGEFQATYTCLQQHCQFVCLPDLQCMTMTVYSASPLHSGVLCLTGLWHCALCIFMG